MACRVLILLGCLWAAQCIPTGHQEPSALSLPKSVKDLVKGSRPYPFHCTIEDGELKVHLGEKTGLLKEVSFVWEVPWSETIDPRQTGDEGSNRRTKDQKIGPVVPDYITLAEETPYKKRVSVTAYMDSSMPYWPATSKGCWTGRKVKKPGPVAKITTYELKKVIAIISIPEEANGPIDGYQLRWCPVGDQHCQPEDLLLGYQVSPIESGYATFLDREEDQEHRDHELCVTAYNLKGTERLLGDPACVIVKPAKQ